MRRLGYISVVDAIYLLQAGIPLYVVSAPKDTDALPLDGAWLDANGQVHYDCSCICINAQTAHAIGREYKQECILYLYPTCFSTSGVFLLKDTPFVRQVALQYAGGYTADGVWLMTAVENKDIAPFSEAHEGYVPADIEFIPVK